MKRKITSALLTGALSASMLVPATAFAEEKETKDSAPLEQSTDTPTAIEENEPAVQGISEGDEPAAEETSKEKETSQGAHFFVRYDSTVQNEDGTTHYSPSNYFPIGDVADGYDYSSGRSDTSSIDGYVKSDTAYVEGAESVVTQAQVNLYHSFNADKDTIKQYFNNVYSDIVVLPATSVISTSIKNALGEEWQANYNNGKIDVLWYVVKKENDGIHVDGVLYWLSTGDSANKQDPVDPAPVPGPEPIPEPEPTPDPQPEPDPTPQPDPAPAPQPSVDPEPSPVPSPESESTNSETKESKVADQTPIEETIAENETPLSQEKTALPKTFDSTTSPYGIVFIGIVSLLGMAGILAFRKLK
jgi:hypothetical protein